MSRLGLAIAVLMAASSCTAALAAPQGVTSLAFGRTGGNIQPFTIGIAADGSVRVTGPVRVLRRQLTQHALASLKAVLSARRFSTLPAVTRCAGDLPDFAAEFVTVRAKTVLVHGDCSPRFDAVYKALSAAVGLRYGLA